jgi:hypothetical protein
MSRPAALSEAALRRARLAAQLLHRPRRMAPVDVVRHLLGFQAQVLSAAGMAMAVRTDGLTPGAVERARVQERSIVLTWAMRGTLHLVAPEDYGWLQPLVVEPRVANSRRRLRELGLTEHQAQRAVAAVERMLGREGPLGRAEVMKRLRRRGIPAEDPAVGVHVLWLAAATGRVCHGPIVDGERRFVLVHDWIGQPRTMDRDAALAEVAVRFLVAHGPSAPADLVFWSGLRMVDVRRAWQALEDRLLEVETRVGRLWTLRSRPERAPAGSVRLLPSFDEYLLGWKDRTFCVEPDRWRLINRGGGWLNPVLLADGRAVATWKGERSPQRYRVEVRPFGRLSAAVRKSAASEAGRIADYLGTRGEAEFAAHEPEAQPR